MKIRVLFVDDEPKLLEGLQRSLRALRNEWETHFAGSGQEALAMLSNSQGESQFDVIVTDMRMPGIDGAALLKIVAERHPDLLRIVLSGQSDLESVVKASGVAHQYLSKPTPLENLKESIVHAFAVNERLKNPRLRSLISGIDSLPSPSRSFLELISALDSPNSSLADIGKIVARDIAICSKVLQMVNSAFFGRSRRISDPVEAVCYLGTGTVKSLVLAVQGFRCFERRLPAGFDVEKLWAHSIECSGLAQRIATDLFPGNEELQSQARTAGLLHDIGCLVVASALPEFNQIVARMRDQRISQWQAEQEILGVTHAEIGAHLLALWGLPSRIVEAVAFHHCPSECASQEFTALALVHIANGLLQSAAQESFVAPIDAAYLDRLGFGHRFAARRDIWLDWIGSAA